MKVIILVFSFLYLIAAQCDTLTSCTTCTSNSACGWCSATGKCLAGTKNGPTNNTTICTGPFWEFQKCQPCDYQRNCRDCLTRNSDCSWCQSINKCFNTGDHPAGCPRANSCLCNSFADCPSCNAASGCSWCSETGTCVITADNTCSMLAHTCPCNFLTSCDLCRQSAAGCVWCNDGTCQNSATATCPITTSCANYCVNNGGTCNTCNNLPSCVWCKTDQVCTSAAVPACSDGFLQHTCNICSSFKTCGACADAQGCGWCSDLQRCAPDHTNCFLAHTCDNFCENYNKDCSTCLNQGGASCGWCPKDKTCRSSSDPAVVCELEYGCGSRHCGFDGGSFAGGMALIVGLILLGIGSYFGYIWWKKNQGPKYTELK